MTLILKYVRVFFISLAIDIKKINVADKSFDASPTSYEVKRGQLREVEKKKVKIHKLDDLLKSKKRKKKEKLQLRGFSQSPKSNRYSNQKSLRRMYRNS